MTNAPTKMNSVKCFVCLGAGKFWLGEADPIEGRKLQDSTPCTCCGGKGEVDPATAEGAACVAYWTQRRREQDEAERVRLEAERKKRAALRKVQRALTDEEMLIVLGRVITMDEIAAPPKN